MHTLFSIGDKVMWQTPEDKSHWQAQYRLLIRHYGPGPFVVIAIEKAPKVPHEQLLTLEMELEGTTVRIGEKTPFCGSWLKHA